MSLPPYDSLNLGLSTADDAAAVTENRRRLVTSLSLDPLRVAFAGQVHGAVVRTVSRPGSVPECDGLVTCAEGLALAVSAADCLPILFTAPGAVAAAHAGWRGAAAGIAEATLTSLCHEARVWPDRVRAHLGPCIRDCCYAVGPEVARLFPPHAVRTVNGELRLSLAAAVRARLVSAGLPPESLDDTGACTACDPHWYYSHRRDRGLTGRQWGVIALTSPV